MAVKGKRADAPERAPKAKKEKQADLPGMEDRQIAELEKAALEYVDGRDERMYMTKKEVELKKKLLEVMHKNDRTTYKHGDIEITIVPEGEKIKVKVHKDEEDMKYEDV